jgi:imidazolonepropionase-like amidohydrolase
VPVEPTLAVFDDIDRYTSGDLSYSALSIWIADPEVMRALLHRPDDFGVPKSFEGWLAVTHANRQIKFDNVATLRRHGVTILVGSDSPNMGHFPGASFHTELDDLVQAGLSPGEALFAATATNAAAFGLAKEVGTIEVGKRADLLLVRGDPSADIYALEHIEAVYLDGQRVLRQP